MTKTYKPPSKIETQNIPTKSVINQLERNQSKWYKEV